MASEAQKAADARYKAANIKQIKFVLNKNTDTDLIAHLESIYNVQGYIKALIRSDMQRGDTYGQTGDHCSICKR